MFHVYAGNVPSIPIWPMLSSSSRRSWRRPRLVLAPHLARAIAEEDDSLGECLAVVWWKGGTAELERAALEAAPAVLAFGGQAAIATIARGARADAKLVLHGPKVSLAYVGKGLPTRERRLRGAPARDRRLPLRPAGLPLAARGLRAGGT